MMTSSPRGRALEAYSKSRSGVRCADTTRTSWGNCELVQQIGGRLHRLPVGSRAHDDADEWFHLSHCSEAVCSNNFIRYSPSGVVGGCGLAVEQCPQRPKQFAARRFRSRRARSARGRTDPAYPFARSRPGRQRSSSSSAGAPSAIRLSAPRFQALETLCVRALTARRERESRANGLRINVAHQLADVLTLPGAAARLGMRRASRMASTRRSGKIERHELGVAQTDERLAQVLGCMSGAFALALAGRRTRRNLARLLRRSEVTVSISGKVAIAAGTDSALLRLWSNQAVSDATGRGRQKGSSAITGSDRVCAARRRQRQGATQTAADASINQGLGVTARLGEVETVEYQRDRGLGSRSTSVTARAPRAPLTWA